MTNADQLTIGKVVRLPSAAARVAAGAGQHAAASTSAKPKATPTAKPTSAPTPPPTPVASPLQQRIAAEALRVGGPNVHVGAAAINLTSGEKVGVRAEEPFASASLINLPLLVDLQPHISPRPFPCTPN